LIAECRGSKHLLAEFGFAEVQPVIMSLLLFMMVLSPIDSLIGYLFKLLSRRCCILSPQQLHTHLHDLHFASMLKSVPYTCMCCIGLLTYWLVRKVIVCGGITFDSRYSKGSMH
jgi:hypothetical protein